MLQNNLAFRAQLVIPEQRDVFDYWSTCCEENRIPARRDIDPRGIRAHLSMVTLYDVEPDPVRFRVRLAGTALRDVYDQDITGAYLDDLSFLTDTALSGVMQKGRPMQGVQALAMPDRERLVQFWLRLPLAEDGQTVNMVLGYDSFMPMAQAAALTAELSKAQAS